MGKGGRKGGEKGGRGWKGGGEGGEEGGRERGEIFFLKVRRISTYLLGILFLFPDTTTTKKKKRKTAFFFFVASPKRDRIYLYKGIFGMKST